MRYRQCLSLMENYGYIIRTKKGYADILNTTHMYVFFDEEDSRYMWTENRQFAALFHKSSAEGFVYTVADHPEVWEIENVLCLQPQSSPAVIWMRRVVRKCAEHSSTQ